MNTNIKYIISILFFNIIFLLFYSELHALSIENKENKVINVDVISVDLEELKCKINNKIFQIKLKNLTESSKEKVIKYAKDNNLYRTMPPLKASVIIKKRSTIPKGSIRNKEQEITPIIKVQAINTFSKLPPLKAKMIVIGIDMMKKWRRNKTVLKVLSNQDISIPAADSGHPREFKFSKFTLEIGLEVDYLRDSDRIYKYYLLYLIDPKNDSIQYWETNYVFLREHIEDNESNAKKFLNLTKDSIIPSKFDD